MKEMRLEAYQEKKQKSLFHRTIFYIIQFVYSVYFHTVKLIWIFCISTMASIFAYVGRKLGQALKVQFIESQTSHGFNIAWGRGIFLLSGVPYDIQGPGKRYLWAKKPPVIFVINHTSSFDIYTVSMIIHRPFHWMAKRSLFKIPILGYSMYAMGHIPVDRGDKNTLQLFQKAIHSLKQGFHLALFPEGTRSPSWREMLPLKKGFQIIAKKSGCKVVPIVLIHTSDILPRKSFLVDPFHRIQIRVLAPIEPDDPQLVEKVEKSMKEEIQKFI